MIENKVNVKQILIHLIFFVICFNAFCQSIPERKPNEIVNGKRQGNWVIWYTSSWYPTELIDSVAFFRKITYKDDVPEGKVVDYFSSGKPQMEMYLISCNPDIKTGKVVTYYESGAVNSEVNYKNGKAENEEIVYYESGKIYAKRNYIEDRLEGPTKYFFESGKIQLTGQFLNNLRTGNWIWYFENEKKEKEFNYLENNLVGEGITYYPSGNIEMIEFFKDDKEEGELTILYDNGNLNTTGWLKNGEKLGRWVWHTEDGDFSSEEYYGLERQRTILSGLIDKSVLLKKQENYISEFEILKTALTYAKDSIGFYDDDYIYTLLRISNCNRNLNKNEDALKYSFEAFNVSQKWLGKSHETSQYCTSHLAQLYQDLGKNEKALPLYLENLSLLEKKLKIGDIKYGIISYNIAQIYFDLKDYEKTEFYYLQSLTNAEKSAGKEDENYISTLDALGDLYYTTEEYSKALPLFVELVNYYEKSANQNDPNYGNRLRYLAVLYFKMGIYDQALPTFEKALKNTELMLGKNHEQYGICLSNFALLYQKMGQFDLALSYYTQGLELVEKKSGKNSQNYAAGLNNLAGLHQEMGYFDKSLTLSLEALEITEKTLGKDNSEYAIRILNLAGLYQVIDRNDLAIPLFLEGMEIIEKTIGKENSIYGTALNNLAGAYKTIGQYEKAFDFFEKALSITEKTLGTAHYEYAQTQNNLALAYYSFGNYDKALELYLNALDNIAKSLGKDHQNYGACLNNIAELYRLTNQNQKAVTYYKESLLNTEKSLGKDHINYTNYLSNLGLVYSQMGNYEKALPIQLEILENFNKNFGKKNSHYRTCLNNLAHSYQSIGKKDQAFPLYEEALNLTFDDIDKNFSYLSEKEKTDFINTLLIDFELYKNFYIEYCKSHPFASSSIYNMELSVKGMILNSGLEMRSKILNSSDQVSIELYEKWNSIKTEIANQYSLPVLKRRSDLLQLEETGNEIEAELTIRSSSFKQAKSLQRNNWTDIQSKLKSNEVAIEYSYYYKHNGKEWTDSLIYFALVIRKTDEYPSIIELFESRQIDSLLKSTGASDALYRGASVSSSNSSFSYGKRLSELIWQPFDKFLNKGDIIYFVPSGPLNQIAFSAVPYNKDSLLSDQYYLKQLSSTSILVKESSSKKSKIESLIAFGGIQYEGSEKEIKAITTKKDSGGEYISHSLPSEIKRGESMEYLPGTLTETKAIVSIAETNNVKVESYYGLDALEETYKKIGLKESPQVLHISTHGFYFPEQKSNYNNQEKAITDNNQFFKFSNNPLNRSGLLFAGANNAWSGHPIQDIEDGILTAYEAANVSLSNTQLVVLSACETGLGDIQGGEGVFGLQRAFKMAGAEYLMMSLWKVPDEETAEFMTLFYSNYFSGLEISEAFNKTQNYMKDKYRKDPNKWAAFILVK